MDVTDTFHINRMLDEIDVLISHFEHQNLRPKARLAAERRGMIMFETVVRLSKHWHMDARGRMWHNTRTGLVFDPVETMRSALELNDEHLVVRVGKKSLCVAAEQLVENLPMSDHMVTMVLLGDSGFPIEKTPDTMAEIYSSTELLEPLENEDLGIEERCRAAVLLGHLIDDADGDWTWYTRVVKRLSQGIQNLEFSGPLLHHLMGCRTLRSMWMNSTMSGREDCPSSILDVVEMTTLVGEEGSTLRGVFAHEYTSRMLSLTEGRRKNCITLLNELQHSNNSDLQGFVDCVLNTYAFMQSNEEGMCSVEALFLPDPDLEQEPVWARWGGVDERQFLPPSYVIMDDELLDIMDF